MGRGDDFAAFSGSGVVSLLASTPFLLGNLYEVHDATLAFDAGSLGRQGKGVKAPQTSARGRGHWVTSRQEGAAAEVVVSEDKGHLLPQASALNRCIMMGLLVVLECTAPRKY